MSEATILVGILLMIFVGVNIGGASTGPAFGPAVGSRVMSMRQAASLMTLSAILGGVLAGSQVVSTLGSDFVPPGQISFEMIVIMLSFTGLAILVGNLRGVPISTSEAAISTITGVGVAIGALNWTTFGQVMIWWFITPVLTFWLGAVVGRYFHDSLVTHLSERGQIETTAMKVAVVGLACFMGFSAGASNVANAIAPLVSSGVLPFLPAAVLGGIAMGIGAFVFGPRTTATVGTKITHLTLEGALVAELITATTVTVLSIIGIPISLAFTMITCLLGLGWGRSTRHLSRLQQLGFGDSSIDTDAELSIETVELFDSFTARKILATWLFVPVAAGILTFLLVWVGTLL